MLLAGASGIDSFRLRAAEVHFRRVVIVDRALFLGMLDLGLDLDLHLHAVSLTWSITSSAGGSCAQRVTHVMIVSMSGVHSSAIFAVASSPRLFTVSV